MIDVVTTIKNKKLNFFGSDSEELFNRNLSIMPIDWHYRTKKIVYDFNSDGYRTKNFKNINWRESVVIFGCSMIMGHGLAEDETVSYYLEKIINRPVINLGLCGSSNELMLNNCSFMVNNFDYPYAIIFSWSILNRFVYYNNNNKVYNCGDWSLEKENNLTNYDKKIIANILKIRNNSQNYLINTNYNYKMIVKAMLKNKTQFLDFSFFDDIASVMKCEFISYSKTARDLCHCGKENTERAAIFLANHMTT